MNAANLLLIVLCGIGNRMRRAGQLVAVIACVVCSSATAHAAPAMPMRFSHISLEDGLSQNNVQSILQDTTGYMWFATESGLNRYDGYNIQNYGRERGNPTGLANDFIWVIEVRWRGMECNRHQRCISGVKRHGKT